MKNWEILKKKKMYVNYLNLVIGMNYEIRFRNLKKEV